MPASTSTVLAVGASGRFAGLVVPELARRGARVRGLIRRPDDADRVMSNGAAEVAVGDLTDPASLDAALEGVASVFYIAPAFLPSEAEVGLGVVEAARRAGVRRFVFSSVIHPVLSELDNHRAKAPVKEAIIDSGMEYVLLQPALFMQNLAGGWPTVVQSGTSTEPWSPDTRFSRVDYRDVAEVAALALTQDHLNWGTYQLCAEGWLNRHDLAALMSEVLGRTIQVGTVGQERRGGAPAGGMQKMIEWYNHHGLLGNPLTLRAILGREPRTLRAYIEELAAQPPSAEPRASAS
ncbi:NmrA family NAD(P)-binding protein [Deinococcus aestuarii]|uniref:NmrA family NAD(P)-binding protein n=1 Tax=Deinococcus aestuarii TaxID=2774531 RepID=UPI001C0BC763|nr:NmrA family NAD(P)-binding protein [Deinococcus aestuarii]